MTTPKAKFAGLALIAVLCAGGLRASTLAREVAKVRDPGLELERLIA